MQDLKAKFELVQSQSVPLSGASHAGPHDSNGTDQSTNRKLWELSVDEVADLLYKMEIPIDPAVVRKSKVN